LQYTDPNIIALPFSFLLAVVVSLVTARPEEGHLERCWRHL
jgi:SSS family solute:Na+ symporter